MRFANVSTTDDALTAEVAINRHSLPGKFGEVTPPDTNAAARDDLIAAKSRPESSARSYHLRCKLAGQTMNPFDAISIAPGVEMPKLGPAQRNRLRELGDRCGETVVYDGTGAAATSGALLILLEPINALRAEALIDSLSDTTVVAIPLGENPAFDAIKDRLTTHGAIGAEGAEGPHHLWWGGRASLTAPTGVYRADGLLLASCGRGDAASGEHLARLRAEIGLFGFESSVEAMPDEWADEARSTWKIDFILQQLDRSDRPLLWIAPEVALKRRPILPQALGCDVAFHRRCDGTVDTRVMGFRPTEPARALLRVWRRLSAAFPDLPESYVFDQAWILTCAQRQLETAWLPRSYCETDPLIRGAALQLPWAASNRDAELNYDVHPQRARRFGRPQPPEPVLVMQERQPRHRPIMVVVRDVREAPAIALSAAVEAIAAAFTADSGGFARLELVLCEDLAEIDRLMADYDDGWVVPVNPTGDFPSDGFARFSRHAAAIGDVALPDAAPDGSVVDLPWGARRNGQRLGPFIRRPLPA
jgi:hypothetical protein